MQIFYGKFVSSLLALSCNYYVEGCEVTTYCKFILSHPAFQDTNNQFWTHILYVVTSLCDSSCVGKTFALKNEPKIHSKLKQTKKVIYYHMECTALSPCTHIYVKQVIILKYVRSWNVLYKHFMRGITEATVVKLLRQIFIFTCGNVISEEMWSHFKLSTAEKTD